MLPSRTISVLALIFVLNSLAIAQQLGFDFQPGQDFYRQTTAKRVQRELNCLQLVAGISDQQRDTVLEKLDSAINERAAELVKQQRVIMFNAAPLPKSLLNAIAVEAKQVIPLQAFQAYEADVLMRQQFQRRAGQCGFLSTMDSLLQLSDTRQTGIAKVLTDNWDDEWITFSSLAVAQPVTGIMMIRKQLKELPQEKLKANLSESQCAALEGIMSLDPAAATNRAAFGELQGKTVGLLKLEEMTELCELSEEQITKLKTPMATARKESVERIRKAWQQNPNIQPNAETSVDMSVPIDRMMFLQDSWTKAIDRILSKEQIEKYNARQQSRIKRNFAMLAGLKVTSYESLAGGLTGKQQVALAKLFEKHLNENRADLQTQIATAIPHAEYKALLNEDQWQKLSAVIESMQ